MKLFSKLSLGAGALTAAGLAGAVGPDFTSLTTGVDFSTVVTAILAIAALKVAPKVVMWGSSVILRMIGR